MRIVQIVPHACRTPKSGREVRIAALASALARIGELHLFNLDIDCQGAGAGVPVAAEPLAFGGEAVVHSFGELSLRDRFPRSLAIRLAGPSGVPFAWRPRSPREGLAWRRLAALAPQVVVADGNLGAPMAVLGPGRLRIVHAHPSAAAAGQGKSWPGTWGEAGEAKGGMRLDREILSRADQVWAAREDERQACVRCGLDPARVVLVPEVIPECSFAADAGPGQAGLAVFYGSLGHASNAEAVAYLIGLAQRWHGQHVDARLMVAGRGASEALKSAAGAAPGLELPGYVPDPVALLGRAAVVLVPLASVGAPRIKTLEAMAAGKPILTTPVGAAELGLEDGVDAVVRDLGPEFDAMALAMLQEPVRFAALGRRAQELVRGRFSQAALDRAVAGVVQAGLAAVS